MNLKRKIFFAYTKMAVFVARIFVSFIRNKDKRKLYRYDLLAKLKKNYLKQYLYALNKDIPNDDKIIKQNNKIWICWLQGEEKAPDIVKACIKSARKYKPDNMEIIIITEDNIKQYANIPDYIYNKWKNGNIINTLFSDIIRLSLLTIHGGIWMDSTVLLTGEIPSDMLNTEFFAFHSNKSGRHNDNWFIIAKSNNKFIKSIRNMLFEYWRFENKMLDYFIYHLFVDMAIENNEEMAKMWAKVPFYIDADSYILEKNMLKRYNENDFKSFLKQPIHKLTYKYDKSKSIKDTYLEKLLNME